MFKLVQNETAWWPVAWNGVAENGSIVENRIEVKFTILGRSEFKKLFMADTAEDDDDRDRAVAERIMQDWRGVADEDGKPLPFTPEFRDMWLDIAAVPTAVIQAYTRLLLAAPEVREKNSAASPAPGPVAAAANRKQRRTLERGARRKSK